MITSLGQFEAQFKNNIKIKIIGLGAVGTGAIKMRSTSQNRDFIFSDHWSFGGLFVFAKNCFICSSNMAKH